MSNEIDLISDYQSKNFEVYFQQDRDEMLKYIPKNVSRVLEVGCGDGSFSKLIKQTRGATVWGVELDKNAASLASKKLDNVILGSFERSLNLPEKNFDCIVFNDVIEHFVDPFSALLYAKDLLQKDGVIVASIPNVRYFDNIWNLLIDKDWKYMEHGILDKTHLRFFTYKSILETFADLGFSVKYIEGVNPIEQKHPHRARKFRFINRILLSSIKDMRYLQFAVVASAGELKND